MQNLELFPGEVKYDILALYHGTEDEDPVPAYDASKADNDYGSGFHLTVDFPLACEWACGTCKRITSQFSSL